MRTMRTMDTSQVFHRDHRAIVIFAEAVGGWPLPTERNSVCLWLSVFQNENRVENCTMRPGCADVERPNVALIMLLSGLDKFRVLKRLNVSSRS
jgi:hypothetical protein